MNKLELPVAAGLTGVVGYAIFQHYTSVAPSLGDLRDDHAHDTGARQKLVDADVLVGGLVVLVGGTASAMSRSWVPLASSLAVLLWVSGYHHTVLASPTPSQIDLGA